jgi:hypothetical protein
MRRQNIQNNHRDNAFNKFCLVKIFVEERCYEWRQNGSICENNRAEIFTNFNMKKIRIENILNITEFALSLLEFQ